MHDDLIHLIVFACTVAVTVYLFGYAEITRWWWQGFLQAQPRLRPCLHRHPNNRWLRCTLPWGHGDLCEHDAARWEVPDRELRPRVTLLSALRLKVSSMAGCANCAGLWAGCALALFLPLPAAHGLMCIPLGGILGMSLGGAVFGAMLWWRNIVALSQRDDLPNRGVFIAPPPLPEGPHLVAVPPESPDGAA